MTYAEQKAKRKEREAKREKQRQEDNRAYNETIRCGCAPNYLQKDRSIDRLEFLFGEAVSCKDWTLAVEIIKTQEMITGRILQKQNAIFNNTANIEARVKNQEEEDDYEQRQQLD
jgi:hypothetical protein